MGNSVIIVNMLTIGGDMLRYNEKISRIVRMFICTDRLHKSYVDRFVGRLGIHRSQHMLLLRIDKTDSKMTQKELAKHLEISPAAVAVSIKKLANDGYIEKTIDDDDNRFNRVTITQKGRDTISRSKEIFTAVDEAMCSELTDTEIEEFEKILLKMTNGLKKLDEKEMLDI